MDDIPGATSAVKPIHKAVIKSVPVVASTTPTAAAVVVPAPTANGEKLHSKVTLVRNGQIAVLGDMNRKISPVDEIAFPIEVTVEQENKGKIRICISKRYHKHGSSIFSNSMNIKSS